MLGNAKYFIKGSLQLEYSHVKQGSKLFSVCISVNGLFFISVHVLERNRHFLYALLCFFFLIFSLTFGYVFCQIDRYFLLLRY